jgi:lipoprotein-anchoring transpeptidase ErfK/SrfK
VQNDDETASDELKNTPAEARFNSPLKSNLVHLHKNLYLNRTDPLYYEKILRYSDPKSPEAHYKLAQRYEEEGNSPKALLHYQEAAKNNASPFYAKARDSIRRLQINKTRIELPMRIIPAIIPTPPEKMPSSTKILLMSVIIFNLLLLFSLLNMDTIRAIISSVKNWSVGMEVVYETVDVPYLIYITAGTPNDKIEKTLYSKAAEMGKQQPKLNIQLYGIMTTDTTLSGKIIPLTSELLKSSAFVIAQYNASVDQSVKIQYQNNDLPMTKQRADPLTGAASNLVRTALDSYIHDTHSPPNNIEGLLSDYPNNYLSFIPNEAQSGSNKIVSAFDGSGGWVYHPKANTLSTMFYPNTLDEPSALEIPFDPVQIFISKNKYTLKVITGSVVLASETVGLGKQDRTPVGSFTIQDRVLNPAGSHPKVYGAAGLSMGQYAIHGTYDESSIRANQSLGCVRLSNADILAIFPLAPKGASVLIAPELPPAAQTALFVDPSTLFPSQKPQLLQNTRNKRFNWLG